MTDMDVYGGMHPRDLPIYGQAEVARYLRLPVTTLSYWVKGRDHHQPLLDLPIPSDPSLSFNNVVEVHVLSALRRSHRIQLQKIRSAIAYVKDEMGKERPLLEQSFETDGVDLFIRRLEEEELISVSEGGQLAIVEAFHEHLSRVRHDASGVAAAMFPLTRPEGCVQAKTISIDPMISFGKPVIDGTGIPTSVLHGRFMAGEEAADLADDYGVAISAIEEAIRCETRIAA